MMIYWFLTFSVTVFSVFYFLLLTFLQRKASLYTLNDSRNYPSVTVIIPARNEAANLPALFQSLIDQTYPVALTEIILINDRSTDSTGELMREFCSTLPNILYIEIDQNLSTISPKKNAIEKAIAESKHEIILTTDADCTHPATWIESMMAIFSPDVSMVLGYAPYRTDSTYKTFFHKLLAFDYMAMGTISLASIAAGYPITSFGANLAYRKSEFERIGGFGQTKKFISGDDDLLVHRFSSQGNGRILFNYSSDSAAYNPPPLRIRDFIRQRLRFSSKHLGYPGRLIFCMVMIYLFNLLLIAGLLYTFFNSDFLLPIILNLLLKAVADIRLLETGRKLLQERSFLHLYPVAVIPHLFYVVLIPLFARIKPQRW